MRILLLLLFPLLSIGQIHMNDTIIDMGTNIYKEYRDTTLLFKGLDTIHTHNYVEGEYGVILSSLPPQSESEYICTICLRNFKVTTYYVRIKTPFEIAKERRKKLRKK